MHQISTTLPSTAAINGAYRTVECSTSAWCREGWQRKKILAAIAELWPDGIPVWLSVAERDYAISTLIFEKGAKTRPNPRTIRRVLGGR